jgi:hypothetical protein
MIYNATIELDVQSSRERLEWLIKNNKRFELTEKKGGRSLSQNRYLHLILGWFGLEYGYTLEEVKTEIFKKVVNPDIFYQGQKEGPVQVEIWRTTSDLNTGEMTLAIDRFRDFSANHGHYLPAPNDLASLEQIERDLSKNSSKQYL